MKRLEERKWDWERAIVSCTDDVPAVACETSLVLLLNKLRMR